jgi:8-oxo-dGTP diphosphatase
LSEPSSRPPEACDADGRSPSPARVVCALIERDGCVLVARRGPGRALAGKWEFPGGKVESGEAAEAALARELREELGVEIEVVRALSESTHRYEAFAITLVPFVCTLAEGEPVAHEHAEIAWSPPENIRDLDLAAADVPILEAYLAARRGR